MSDGEHWFFTMELVAGIDFLEYVRGDAGRQQTSIDAEAIDRLRPTLRQLAEGICALHEIGKLHRDIKPSNVLVTDEGRVVILDFGLVEDIDPDLHETLLAGTPDYMSPEQGAQMAISKASDWYSVGVILYQSLTGRFP